VVPFRLYFIDFRLLLAIPKLIPLCFRDTPQGLCQQGEKMLSIIYPIEIKRLFYPFVAKPKKKFQSFLDLICNMMDIFYPVY
jgi:hypothetical protein